MVGAALGEADWFVEKTPLNLIISLLIFLVFFPIDTFKKSIAFLIFFAGGTGHPYFSTDTAAALRAIETECDVILLAKNIDGVYDSDPKVNKDAVKFNRISLKEVIDKDLKVMDLTAAIMCLEQKVAMSVFYLNDKNSIINALEDKANGTLVYV
jgi:uridylate kinase